MGAMSRSGIKRLLIGNTAERILDDLSCDILIVKPVNFRVRIPRASRGARFGQVHRWRRSAAARSATTRLPLGKARRPVRQPIVSHARSGF